ncbi:MAG: peptidoglycan DD-metalloendopeptidase family protein [Syntrophotaleaceae bacterium]
MNFDFKPKKSSLSNQPRARRSLSLRRIAAPLLVFSLLAGGLFFMIPRQETMEEPPEIVEPAREQALEPEIRREVVEGAIQPGETITSLLGHLFTPQEIHNLGQECKDVFPLSKLCAGQNYRLSLLGGSFESLEYDIDRDDLLIIRQGEEGFEVAREPIPYTTREEVVSGTIMSNLFDAVVGTGESEILAINLADIFAWDVDFIRDIHPGDSFQVLVEKRFREGNPAGYGRILAATFTNQGETFEAFLYKDGDQKAAYYDRKGKSLRKAFLRAPLSFSRISSGFSLRRFHPITKTWKAHPAIDYAAPTGTPIKAIGNGTIIRSGYTKYNGNFIKLRHANGIESLYLHMSRFARNMKTGKRVAQGQIIGYVGSTGLATGPHLCFRMTKNGKPINPNKLKKTPDAPISKANMKAYKASIQPLLAQLENPVAPETRKALARQAEIESLAPEEKVEN